MYFLSEYTGAEEDSRYFGVWSDQFWGKQLIATYGQYTITLDDDSQIHKIAWITGVALLLTHNKEVGKIAAGGP